MTAYPPLRQVDAFQIEHEGQPMIVIRDPERLCPEPILVPMPVFLIASLLDGERDTGAIQAAIMNATQGQIVPGDQIDNIVRQFDELHLLVNERAWGRQCQMEAEFAQRLTRPAAHAGQSYPESGDDCRKMFDEFFAGVEMRDGDKPCPRGLIVPHIDLRIGGACLARGLAAVGKEHPPRLYIVLGVAHQGSKNLFTLTDKSFETPLGLMRADRRAAERLRELYGAGRLDGEYAHRFEHSIEFPALALRYLHGDAENMGILPILCGSLHELVASGAPSPMELPDVHEFVAALQRLIEEYERQVCIVASVDLSHVGRKFGDERGIDEVRPGEVEAADRTMLGLVTSGGAEDFFNFFRADGNAGHVDAVTAVYVMMQVLQRQPGVLIDYQQWHEAETDSMVTYASMSIA